MANISVFGIYATASAADAGVMEMRRSGFRKADISVLLSENVGTKEFAFKKGPKAPEAGVTSGAILGGALEWLVGIGALAIPGLEPFIAAGPIMAALGGMGLGGALGGFTGALIGMGIPEYEAKRYQGLVQGGAILVSVNADDSKSVSLARDIMLRTEAQDIASAGESKGDFVSY
jgi:hypothetical protein